MEKIKKLIPLAIVTLLSTIPLIGQATSHYQLAGYSYSDSCKIYYTCKKQCYWQANQQICKNVCQPHKRCWNTNNTVGWGTPTLNAWDDGWVTHSDGWYHGGGYGGHGGGGH